MDISVNHAYAPCGQLCSVRVFSSGRSIVADGGAGRQQSRGSRARAARESPSGSLLS